MVLVLVASYAWAACDATATPSALDSTIGEALDAYGRRDQDEFLAQARTAGEQVVCLETVLTPKQVAAWDRVEGLRRVSLGDSDAALAAFRAAVRLDPGFSWSDEVAPEGGKVAKAWAKAAGMATSATEGVGKASGGDRVWVDGTESGRRPTEQLAVLQIGPSSTSLDLSVVLHPGDPLPSQLSGSGASSRTSSASTNKAVVPLWIATGASALLAGGLYGAAVATNIDFQYAPTEGGLTANHVTYVGAIGFAGAAVALAGISIAVTL